MTHSWLVQTNCIEFKWSARKSRCYYRVVKSVFWCFFSFLVSGARHTPLYVSRQYIKGPARRVGSLTLSSRTATKKTDREQRLKSFLANPLKDYPDLKFTFVLSRVCPDLLICLIFFRKKGTMMFNFNADCDSSSRCSTASPSVDTLGYYPSPAGSYSSMGSPQSQVCPLKHC